MSNAGQSPKFKRVRYETLAEHPANPLEGDVHYADGSGSIAQGVWFYDGTVWQQLVQLADTFFRKAEFFATGAATFNVPAGVSNVLVFGSGGGGGGAGGARPNASNGVGAGGGGGTIPSLIPYPVTPSGTVAVNVGAGGPEVLALLNYPPAMRAAMATTQRLAL